MGRIRKLPFLSGCLAAILAGIISYAAGADNQTIYIRMAVMMLLFYILGVYFRNTVFSVKREIEIKKIESKKEEEYRQKKQREEQIAEALASRKSRSAEGKIDLTAGDTQIDEFEPLKVSKAIKTKVNE